MYLDIHKDTSKHVTVSVDHSTVDDIGDPCVDICHNIIALLCRDKSNNSVSMFYI